MSIKAEVKGMKETAAQRGGRFSLLFSQIRNSAFYMLRITGAGNALVRSLNGFSGGIRPALLVLVSVFLFASCTTQGDFGRDRPSIYKDEILPSIRNFVAVSNGKPVSRFALTDREKKLRTYRRRIARDMSYPTVESYFTSTAASMGLTQEPPPHLGENIRSHNNARKPVVDIQENAKENPYALASEIEEDIVLIQRARILSQLIIADDRLRLRRLAGLQDARQSDRDDVSVRVQENLTQIKYIQYVATLRVKRYRRVIDKMSIADPVKNLQSPRALLEKLEIEVNYLNNLPLTGKKPIPARNLDRSYGQEL